MSLVGLHHVQLSAPPGSEEALRRFYGTVLGMTELPKPPVLAARGGAWFRSGALELHLGIEEDFRPSRKAHPGLLTDNLDALATRLAEHGVEVTWDEHFPGYRRCYVTDPHGNRLELLQPVAVLPLSRRHPSAGAARADAPGGARPIGRPAAVAGRPRRLAGRTGDR